MRTRLFCVRRGNLGLGGLKLSAERTTPKLSFV